MRQRNRRIDWFLFDAPRSERSWIDLLSKGIAKIHFQTLLDLRIQSCLDFLKETHPKLVHTIICEVFYPTADGLK